MRLFEQGAYWIVKLIAKMSITWALIWYGRFKDWARDRGLTQNMIL